jgi:hypothetical protein
MLIVVFFVQRLMPRGWDSRRLLTISSFHAGIEIPVVLLSPFQGLALASLRAFPLSGGRGD